MDVGERQVCLDSRFLRSQADRPAIQHGYAITCHIAQRMTVDRAYVLASSGLCREWGYTALTRGRRENHLYLADRPVHERDEYAPSSGVHALTALESLQSRSSAPMPNPSRLTKAGHSVRVSATSASRWTSDDGSHGSHQA